MFVSDKNFYKMMLAIGLPIAVQNFISFLVGLVDSVMVGRVSESSLAGVNLAGQLFFITMIFIVGVGEGSNILISQFYGKGDTKSIRKIYPFAYLASIITGILAFVVGFFFNEEFMRIYADPSDTVAIAEGAKYLKILSFSYIPFVITECTVRTQRAVQSAHISLYIYSTSLVVNASLNYLLIFGNFGFPALGVEGAAIATLCARLVELTMALTYIFKIDKKIKLKISDLKIFDKDILINLMKNSAPILTNDILWVFGSTFIAIIFAKMGESVVAANVVSSNVFQLVSVALFGISSASSVITGNSIGMGKIDNAFKYSKTFVSISFIVALITSLTVYLTKDIAISIYDLTPSTAIIAHEVLSASSIILFFQSIALITGMGVLRGGGDGKFVLIYEIIMVWCIAVPLGAVAAFIWELPVFWVYIITRLDEILKAILFTGRILFSKKWIKDLVNK